MLQFQLVAADLDGTLLRDDKTISDRTRRAIALFQERGGRFTIATGRNLESASRFLPDLRITTPVLLLNGGLIHDLDSGHDVACQRLDNAVLERVWPILADHAVDLVVHGPRRGTAGRVNAAIEAHMQHDGISLDLCAELGPGTVPHVVKVLMMGAPAVLDSVDQAIRATGLPVVLVRSYDTYLELLPAGGGKGPALEALLERLGVPVGASLALGDGLNDLDLLNAAGLGVAMGNGHPQVRRAARYVAPANQADGVAQVLEAICGGRVFELLRPA